MSRSCSVEQKKLTPLQKNKTETVKHGESDEDEED
jgi:hypothetical protein